MICTSIHLHALALGRRLARVLAVNVTQTVSLRRFMSAQPPSEINSLRYNCTCLSFLAASRRENRAPLTSGVRVGGYFVRSLVGIVIAYSASQCHRSQLSKQDRQKSLAHLQLRIACLCQDNPWVM